MLKTILSVPERTLIRREGDRFFTGNTDEVAVSDAVFDALKQVATQSEEADHFLSYSWQKGQEIIRLRSYVGLLLLPNGTQLEILPNIWQDQQARSTLIRLLRQLRNSPFRTFSSAYTRPTKLPLWEVFIGVFLDLVEKLGQQGIQRAYVPLEQNERFWKGRFQATRQLRENDHHAERLAVRYDVLTANVPPNRILKATLHYLCRYTSERENLRRLQLLLGLLDEVPVSASIPDDLLAIRRMGRLFRRYEPALCWAEALLQGSGYGVRVGQVASLSLLFAMERVFEDYVAYAIRTYWPNSGQVRLQENSNHLVDEHDGNPRFRLRPDLVIRQGQTTWVLDTKWKQIKGDAAGPATYGIDQADLYQLYAYGKKYQASDLFLIYPANETFYKPLAVFGYDPQTRLHVVPFNLANPAGDEVEKLAAYALSFQ